MKVAFTFFLGLMLKMNQNHSEKGHQKRGTEGSAGDWNWMIFCFINFY